MCKIWGCTVDDPVFETITESQWLWYANMVAKDEQDSNDLTIDLIEYLASYWNAEAVQKVKQSRERPEDHGFASDEEFEEQIVSGAFKEDSIVQAIRDKYKNTNLESNNMNSNPRTRRLPKDLSSIRDLFGDD